MIGTFFNTGMIICGSIIGSLFKRGLNEKYHQILMQALGLAVVLLGINTTVSHMGDSKYPVLFIVSLALGGVIGQLLNLEERFDRLLGHFSSPNSSNLAQGLSTAILLFCIGTLSIIGPIEAALKHNYTYLFTNGMLDGITSMVLASTFGIGIIVASLVLFCWQGGIYALSILMQGAISGDLITELSVVGGVLILASGINILKIAEIHTLNLLPALVMPAIIIPILHALGY
ncbi:DUF554 domain-containing protein [Paucilactobacillus suebicus]|nr:DUF554 domain-containing protein [Paucilactobacillus suebicus]